MKSATRLASFFAVGLAAYAHAGQHFSFADPIANGSYTNSMFESGNLLPGNSIPSASILNFYTGTVALTTDNFSPTGAYLGSSTSTARYFLSGSSALTNATFSGGLNAGVYATGGGQIIFTSQDLTTTYLRIAFTSSALTYGSFFGAQGLTFSGSLYNPADTGNENASFSFPDRFTLAGNNSLAHHTSTFTASVGRIGVVPEPAPVAALSMGALVLLRRRRSFRWGVSRERVLGRETLRVFVRHPNYLGRRTIHKIRITAILPVLS